MNNIAIFLDRDGTVSEEVGYINHLSRFRLFPWTAPAIKRINDAGLKAILITNQAGVARGYFTEDLIVRVHEHLCAELSLAEACLDGVYYCPHHPKEGVPPYRALCDCRKPKPGLLERAAREHEIDLNRSFMVGDRYSDMALARSVGAKAVMVLTGYGRGEYEYQRSSWTDTPDHITENLLTAVDWILDRL
jgi:D-glycero-D-manno-heptose 1,7-bisphosphate phosphatase